MIENLYNKLTDTLHDSGMPTWNELPLDLQVLFIDCVTAINNVLAVASDYKEEIKNSPFNSSEIPKINNECCSLVCFFVDYLLCRMLLR